jgi:hypothetical protein
VEGRGWGVDGEGAFGEEVEGDVWTWEVGME